MSFFQPSKPLSSICKFICEGDVRQLPVDFAVSLDELKALLSQEYKCPRLFSQYEIKYKDSDSDMITAVNMASLQDAYMKNQTETSRCFRIYIVKKLNLGLKPGFGETMREIGCNPIFSDAMPVLVQALNKSSEVLESVIVSLGTHGQQALQYLTENVERFVEGDEFDLSLKNGSDIAFPLRDGPSPHCDAPKDEPKLNSKSPLQAKDFEKIAEKLECTFLADVTIPDGMSMPCNFSFVKVWKLLNPGTCAWPPNCQLVYLEGSLLTNVRSILVKDPVPVGSAVRIRMNMTSPSQPGRHVSFWQLRDPNGELFGCRIWVDIICTNEDEDSSKSQKDNVLANGKREEEESSDINPSSMPWIESRLIGTRKPQSVTSSPYEAQLAELKEMGFNSPLIHGLLDQHAGNLSKVIDEILSIDSQ